METLEKPKLKPPVVKCAYSKMVNVNELIPHPRNPNSHPPKQIETFIAILQYQGARRPITVSTLSGFVTKGHGQLLSYQSAGWEVVPVDYQDYGSEEEELADLVADNQLNKMSEMNTGKLQEIGVLLDTGAFDMKLLGMEERKLEQLMTVTRGEQSLSGAEGTPLAGAPVEPNQDLPAGSEGSVQTEAPSSSSHVRMVQLFFTDETQAEFMEIMEHFQEKLNIDNITDATLEVLRAAYRSSKESE